MLRSQRVLLVAGLVLIAWLLHTNTCEWVFKESLPFNMRSLCAWEHDKATTLAAAAKAGRSLYPLRTGLVTDSEVDHTAALVIGMAAPLLLLMWAGYLILGWKRDARIRRGLCTTCGYDLRGAAKPLAKCPECGTPATKAGG